MDTITYRQLLDFTIGVLYELRVKQGRAGLFSLKKIVSDFDYKTSFDEIRDIAKYLEAQGYVKPIFTFGDVFLEITTRGIIYFEDKDKEFIFLFQEYLNKTRLKEQIKSTVEQLDKNINSSKE